MKSRIKKSIDRLLARTIPTAPSGAGFYFRVLQVRHDIRQPRTALREARKLVQEASPLRSRPAMKQWMQR